MKSPVLFRCPLACLSLAIGLCLLGGPLPCEAVDFHVAPSGDDANPGTVWQPFATADRARAAARELKQREPDRDLPVVVQLRGGTYFLPATVVFRPEDSGTARAPIVFEAAPGESPILSAGVLLTNWQVLPNGHWRTTLPEVAAGGWNFSQLYVNDQRRTRPVAPRDGYFFIEAAVPPSEGTAPNRFRFKAGDINPAWRNLNHIEVCAVHKWSMSRLPIASVHAGQRVVTLAGGTWGERHADLTDKIWYRLDNVAEALGQPGDWYLDRATWSLTYVPMPGEDPRLARVIAPRHDRVISLEGDVAARRFVEHLTFRGLTLAHSGWNVPPQGHSAAQSEVSVDGAFTARNTRHVTLERCVVRHTGNYAVDFSAGCWDNRVEGCELFDLGAGGVKIGPAWGGNQDRRDRSGRTVVHDNLIAHIGRVHPAGTAIWIGHAASNTVARNEVFDTYWVAIAVGWSWRYGPSPAHHNLIASNHIHQIGQAVLSDIAGIYTLGEQPGSALRYNRVHDVSRARYGGWGLYYDEGSSLIPMENNLVYRTEDAPWHMHWARSNVVANNIWAFGTNAQIHLTDLQKSGPIHFERNIFYWREGPLLLGTPDSEITFRSNLYWRVVAPEGIRFADGAALAQWRAREPGAVVADPWFVNPDAGDFRLRPGSPAARVGFVPFDLNAAGRVTKTARTATLPRPPRTYPPAPPEPAIELREDFEQLALGQAPAGWTLSSRGQDETAAVTDESAASGTKSLRFQDGPSGERFHPHLYHRLAHSSGVIRIAFDLRVERGAWPSFESRDTNPWHTTGMLLEVLPDRTLRAAGRDLMKVPVGQWLNVEMVGGVGPDSTGHYRLTVRLPGEAPRVFDELPYRPGFKTLGWIGFSAMTRERRTFYVDNFVLERVRD